MTVPVNELTDVVGVCVWCWSVTNHLEIPSFFFVCVMGGGGGGGL